MKSTKYSEALERSVKLCRVVNIGKVGACRMNSHLQQAGKAILGPGNSLRKGMVATQQHFHTEPLCEGCFNHIGDQSS